MQTFVGICTEFQKKDESAYDQADSQKIQFQKQKSSSKRK